MSNIISTIILLLIPQIASAGLFDRDTKVRLTPYMCEAKGDSNLPGNFIVSTFFIEKLSVVRKDDVYHSKKLVKSDLLRLDKCIVANKNNWQCDHYRVVDGKFFLDIGTPSSSVCIKVEQLN